MLNKKNRPVYLNLFKIRLAASGVLSFLHRISGVILALSFPLFLWAFSLSLNSQRDFDYLLGLFEMTATRLILAMIIWSLAHHLLTGIRFLLGDLGLGMDKKMTSVISITLITISALLFTGLVLRAIL